MQSHSFETDTPQYAIDIVKLSKSFKRKTHASYSTIKSTLVEPLLKRKRKDLEEETNVTHALRSLTMRIPQGSSLGVIGRNGSGKSTLLKLITGIYKADTGHVKVNGRLAALIELGAGFHPDFTGRENVFLAAAMYGLSKKQVEKNLDDIIAFAELEHVIDDPVRTYSSGMFMRLGFSVAIHINPDVLLIDEVLAVGDEGFVSKCKVKISELRKAGKTLLLVSHDLAAVERWCDEVIWLHEGIVKDRGDPRRVIDHYRHFIERGEEEQIVYEEEQKSEEIAAETAETPKEEARRWGSREIEITNVILRNKDKSEQRVFRTGDTLELVISYKKHEDESDTVFGLSIDRSDGLHVYGSNTTLDDITVPALKDSGEVCFSISSLDLLEGAYFIDVAVHKEDGYPFDYHKGIVEFHVKNAQNQIGVWKPQGEWSF